MPRPARRSKSRRAGFDQSHINHVLHGCYLYPGCGFTSTRRGPGGDFTDFEALRQGWELLRAELLPAFIAEHPGTRPYAWWLFDAPERRQRVDGVVHGFDDRVRRQHVEQVARVNPSFRETAYRLFYGKPSCLCVKDDFEAKYESEAEYLSRLGLLNDAERREIFG